MDVIVRQKAELVNRHQLLMFLHVLLGEIEQVLQFSTAAAADFNKELTGVTELIGGKGPVPKNDVYVCVSRLFDSLRNLFFFFFLIFIPSSLLTFSLLSFPSSLSLSSLSLLSSIPAPFC